MDLVLLFIIIFAISATGSLVPGLVNLMVMKRSIIAGKRSGMIAILGSVLPEIVYSYIAVAAYNILDKNMDISLYIQILGAILFLSLSGFYFFKKAEVPDISVANSRKDDWYSFRLGFFTTIINLPMIPAWAFVAGFLQPYGYDFTGFTPKIVFAMASMLGASTLFVVYAQLGQTIVNRMVELIVYVNRFFAVVFLVLGVYQLFQLSALL